MKLHRIIACGALFGLAVACSSADNNSGTADGGTDGGAGGGAGADGSTSDTGTGGTAGTGGSAGTGGDAGSSGTGGAGPVNPLPGNGCPSTTGLNLKGTVRLAAKLHPVPEVTETSVVVKVPCGHEVTDPEKKACGTGHGYVFLCSTPDCSAESDPIRSELRENVSMKQATHDTYEFEMCGIEAGTYYVLPFIDHDKNKALSNYDWTMGVKDLASVNGSWPARVQGHKITLTENTVLASGKLPGRPDTAPVVIDFFHYKHPTPEWKAEEAWLYIAASLHKDMSATGYGVRVLDLAQKKEIDQVTSSPAIDGRSLSTPEGTRYEGDLDKLAFHDGVAYLAANVGGPVIFTVSLKPDGTLAQGKSIDLRAYKALVNGHVLNRAAVVKSGSKTWLAITTRERDEAPLPHAPKHPLVVVDLEKIATEDIKTAKLYDSADALHKVRFDEVFAEKGVVYLAESGGNSRARKDDMNNRLWAVTLDDNGEFKDSQVYVGTPFVKGTAEECSDKNYYRRAGLWVGQINGKTHAVLGGQRHLAVWSFATDKPEEGKRLQNGTAPDLTDLRLDDYSTGYSLLRASPDGKRLYVFGECKSRYLSVRPDDWSGSSTVSTQSRRRIAVLDLENLDADGLPTVDKTVGDKESAPDIVREKLTSPNITLSEEMVGGIGMDCRAVLWNLFDVFGYKNIAGNTFNSACVASVVRDAVVTNDHIYIIGMGSSGEHTNPGLGPASEVWLLDLKTGREVLDPSWRWFYDGSTYQKRYGYFGLTLGERSTVEISKGLFLVPKL